MNKQLELNKDSIISVYKKESKEYIVLETIKTVENNKFELYFPDIYIDKSDVFFIKADKSNEFEDGVPVIKGIELLKLLRIAGYKQHVVLFSSDKYIDRDNLIKINQRNIIIYYQGTTFINLQSLGELQIEKLKAINNLNGLKEFIRPSFNISKTRHAHANWWGLKTLWDINNQIKYKKEIKKYLDYPQFVKSGLTINNNIIASYLYSDFINANKQTYYLKTRILKKQEQLQKLDKKNILYIDDKADTGWEEIFKYMLGDNVKLTSITPKPKDFTEEEIQGFYQKVINKLNNKDLLLLDVRLIDEKGVKDVTSLSGIKLFNYIREEIPSMPIIITTASNKSETVNYVLNKGADALWTKPGIDQELNSKSLYKQYFEFLNVVYKSLTKFKTKIDKEIFKTDIKLAQIKKTEIKRKIILNDNIDYVILDTNVFLANEKIFKYHKLVYFFYLWSQRTKKKILIINDVKQELLIKTSSKDDVLRKLAKYSLDRIFLYDKSKYIDSAHNIISKTRVINYSVKKIPYMNEYYLTDNYFNLGFTKNDNKFGVFNAEEKLISIFDNEKEANDFRIEKQKSNKRILHADDTFKSLILYLLHCKKNVLFISNDEANKAEIFNIVSKSKNVTSKESFSSHMLKRKQDTDNYIRGGKILINNNVNLFIYDIDSADKLFK